MKILHSFFVGIIFLLAANSCSKPEVIPAGTDPVLEYKLKLTGSVKSCNGNNLSNGNLIILSNQGYMSLNITNGTFDTTLISNYIFDSVMVWAVDLGSLTTSDTLMLAVSGDSMNLGLLSTCADVDEYIKCKIDTEDFVFVPNFIDSLNVAAWDTLNAPTTYFYRNTGTSNNRFYRMQFAGMATGTYGVNWNSSISIGRYYSFNMPTTGTVTYTTYGDVGEYITGTINVPFVDNTDSLNHLLTGTFKVRRDR